MIFNQRESLEKAESQLVINKISDSGIYEGNQLLLKINERFKPSVTVDCNPSSLDKSYFSRC